MGRRSKTEINFQDFWLEKLISNFCINVKKIRISKRLTQQQLAERAQIAINTIAEIEQHRIENLRLSTITAVGHAFKVDPVNLLKAKKIHTKKNRAYKEKT